MDEIGRISRRYSELMGRRVIKIPQFVLDMESAYKELSADYVDMCKDEDDKNHCERVYRGALKMRRGIAEYYAANGLEQPEYLARGLKPKQTGPPRDDVSGNSLPASDIRLALDTGTRKARNIPARRRAR